MVAAARPTAWIAATRAAVTVRLGLKNAIRQRARAVRPRQSSLPCQFRGSLQFTPRSIVCPTEGCPSGKVGPMRMKVVSFNVA